MRALTLIGLMALAAVLLAACGSDPSLPIDGAVRITCADVQAPGAASRCSGEAAALAIGDPPMPGGTVSAVDGMAAITSTLQIATPRNLVIPFVFDTSCDGSQTPGYFLAAGAYGSFPAGDTPLYFSSTCQGIPGTRLLYVAIYDDESVFSSGGEVAWTPGADPAHLLDQASVQFTMTP